MKKFRTVVSGVSLCVGNAAYPLCLSFTLFAGFEGLEGVNVPLDVDEDTVININEKVGPGNLTEINQCFLFI